MWQSILQVSFNSFLARCLASVMALSVLWLLVAAAYTEALATSVGVLLPQQQDIQASGTVLDLLVRLPSGPMSGLLLTINMQTWGFGYGIVLTGALVLSTPGWRLLSRIYWLGIAWAVLFVAQIVVIGMFGRIAYSSLLGDGNPGLLTFGYWLMYGVWLMLPPILWVAWSFKLWMPKLRAS